MSASVRIPRKMADRLTDFLESLPSDLLVNFESVEDLRKYLAPKLPWRPQARKAEKKAKRTKKNAETAGIWASVVMRSRARCEACSAHIYGGAGCLDHFRGRRRVAQAVWNCWYLCPNCNDRKTQNQPSARYWTGAFLLHARSHRLDRAIRAAEDLLAYQEAKASLPASPKSSPTHNPQVS